MRFPVYLYASADGDEVVSRALKGIARSAPEAFSAIVTGVRMLEEHGANRGLGRFDVLRHVEGGTELWEMRANGRPAHRVLFAPVPGGNGFVLLDVIRKDEMTKGSKKYIDRALERLDDWLAAGHPSEGEGQ
ncbi:MAG: type II toxin-antitoxin system RelE/ParE family toxin [Dehalococcoidia bacterium]|nr:type II toxin-antitoxin system RelE/ParE family toxin [Dehalococcoidia bacterium]